jgi:GTP cyclohydrolase IV
VANYPFEDDMTDTASTPSAVIDVQASAPPLALSLSRVGVTDVEKVIRMQSGGTEQLFSARFECVIELGSDQKGAHMSRFEEVVNDSIGEVVLGGTSFKVEYLAERIAQLVRERQGARRAEVTVEARFPEHKPAPVSGVTTQEIYTLHGIAAATASGTRRITGVTAQGLTACPCAQELVAASARTKLTEQGFGSDEIERIFEAVPVATPNQRGLGSLYIGAPEGSNAEFEAATLLAIVEESMSSEIYELMKRTDEGHVVEKAHRRPRFVEDCVRETIRGVIEAFPQLDGGSFVSARQVNLESIHQHNVVAERYGLLSEIRSELAGDPGEPHTNLQAWLAATA